MRFKDVFSIIGPAMVGPSSSHTAGAVRIGLIARQLFGDVTPESADVSFYGSFAETHQGHGTDVALTGGLLGFGTDDPRIPSAFDEAEAAGMAIRFRTAANTVYHPNTAKLVLTGGDRRLTLIGSSIGGGNVEIVSVDDFDVKFTGAYPTFVLYHRDRPGFIADVTERLRRVGINIGCMDVDRSARGGNAMTVIEADNTLPPESFDELRAIEGMQDVRSVDLTAFGNVGD